MSRGRVASRAELAEVWLADRREHFPETEQTFVHDSIDAGRVPELASYLMEVYYEPLCIYCRATSYRTLGEPEEIVGGFFASRLSDPTWIARWRDESRARSLPLRRWLQRPVLLHARGGAAAAPCAASSRVG